MCSTPKSSGSQFSNRRRNHSQPNDYQAYARMLREASANFERVQALKEERRLAALAEADQGDRIAAAQCRSIRRISGSCANFSKKALWCLWALQ